MVNKKPRLLIVDDEQAVCDLLYDQLSERGYSCTTALDGNEALAKLSAQDFDVVLLDIKLPKMSGMEILSNIRSAHHHTAAIMLTAVDNVNTVVEAMKLGASDYIVKPFDLDKVDASIFTASVTKKRSAEQREYEAPVGSEEEGKQVTHGFLEMDAIACGVEARVDLLFSYSKMVTQRTVDIARQLGIAEEKIQRWAKAKAMSGFKRDKIIKSLLKKLERSPLAQSMMGITVSYVCRRYLSDPQN
ncbi:Regulator of RpoS [subsurface metagenome]